MKQDLHFRPQYNNAVSDALKCVSNAMQENETTIRKVVNGDADVIRSPESEEDILIIHNNIRFRMAAVAIGFDLDNMITNGGRSRRSPIVVGAGGVTYGRFDESIVILLPDIRNKEGCKGVLDDLLEIYDSPRGDRSNWVVDFSALTHPVPLMLIGVLRGYLSSLQKNNADIILTWLKPTLVKAPLLELTKQAFNLTEIGGHLLYTAPGTQAQDSAGHVAASG